MASDELSLNLVQIYLDRVSRYQSRPALYFKDKARQGAYTPISWTDWAAQVRRFAYALKSLGAVPGARIGLLSENRPEWTVADLAILSLGAIVVPVYPTSSCQDLEYYIQNAGIEIFIVSTEDQLQRTREVLLGSRIKTLITLNLVSVQNPKIRFFGDLLESGTELAAKDPEFYEKSVASVKPDTPATIIYTSGTTGPPKGVVLTHKNFVANYIGSKSRITILDTDVALSFLPLNHVFERLAGYYFMIFHGAAIAYAESMQTVAADMQIVKPTVAAAVPRFYEKVYAGIREKLQTASPAQRTIFEWAVRVGKKRYADRLAGKRDMIGDLQYALAKILVFKKIRRKLGGRIKFFISGGAPLAKELAEFFYAADILILEGYGLTETSPVIAVNSTHNFRFGTVGEPLPNIEVKIAQDGEILTKGPCVMTGYFQNEAATREVIIDGWFHTGDIGVIEPDGFLKITDRKKDIIATSGGKKVSPQNIEGLIMGDTLFSNVVVIGERRNYLTALIVPNRDELLRKAKELGCESMKWEELIRDPGICKWAGERLKLRTADMAQYEQIKYFTFLPEELSVKNGELTPTMKVKRKVVNEKYKDLIEAMYRHPGGQSA